MRDNRARRRANRILVDGWRETQRAIESGLVPIGVYVASAPGALPDDSMPDDAFSESQRWVRQSCEDVICQVSPVVMQKIAYGQSDRGVVAEFQSPKRDLSKLKTPESGLVLVLDRLEKPGNIGAAFRCADAAGAGAVILTPSTADRFNPNAIRSSLGAVFSVPSAAADEHEARDWLVERGYRLCAARVESSRAAWQTDLTGRVAIIIGSESKGLKDNWRSRDDAPVEAVRIPMAGKVDSLNASVSAAVLLYEAQRQRSGGVGRDL